MLEFSEWYRHYLEENKDRDRMLKLTMTEAGIIRDMIEDAYYHKKVNTSKSDE